MLYSLSGRQVLADYGQTRCELVKSLHGVSALTAGNLGAWLTVTPFPDIQRKRSYPAVLVSHDYSRTLFT